MSEPILLVETARPAVVTLTLNRPARRNALSIALLRELYEAIGRYSADPAYRVLILRGNGPSFCSGLDLQETLDFTIAKEGAEWIRRIFEELAGSTLVTICSAHGAAMAGGAGLLACCNFAVATEGVKIGFPEVRRGLVPALVATILTRKLKGSEVRELLLLAEPVDARRALDMGLVHRVVPDAELAQETDRLADLVLAGAPRAIRQTKRLIRQLRTASESAAEHMALQAHIQARASDEAREGLAAFYEKRKPRWK
jgi:methylglutaconyl-CoA hydratase